MNWQMLFWPNFRYFNVIGSDPDGRLGEAPRPELREHGRISGACFDAARGIVAGLKVFWFLVDLEFFPFRSKLQLHCWVISRLCCSW
jgi:hypothetical protein